MSPPLVTIIIGVRNGAATLARCLDSIAAQTLTSRETIVMDGASTDGTVGLLKARADVQWRSEPDRGLYDAWNKALRLRRGAWVLFLGADDCFVDAHVLEQFAS